LQNNIATRLHYCSKSSLVNTPNGINTSIPVMTPWSICTEICSGSNVLRSADGGVPLLMTQLAT
jgi:hypothetical protein